MANESKSLFLNSAGLPSLALKQVKIQHSVIKGNKDSGYASQPLFRATKLLMKTRSRLESVSIRNYDSTGINSVAQHQADFTHQFIETHILSF